MVNFSYGRANIRTDAVLPLINRLGADGPELEELGGLDFLAEVFASDAARNAALGPVNELIEIVIATQDEIAANEYPRRDMAIGPDLNDPDFAAVATPILDAILADGAHDSIAVVIGRTRYELCYANGVNGPVSVAHYPLYRSHKVGTDFSLERDTASWLRGYVSGRAPAFAN